MFLNPLYLLHLDHRSAESRTLYVVTRIILFLACALLFMPKLAAQEAGSGGATDMLVPASAFQFGEACDRLAQLTADQIAELTLPKHGENFAKFCRIDADEDCGDFDLLFSGLDAWLDRDRTDAYCSFKPNAGGDISVPANGLSGACVNYKRRLFDAARRSDCVDTWRLAGSTSLIMR